MVCASIVVVWVIVWVSIGVEVWVIVFALSVMVCRIVSGFSVVV